MNLVVEISPTAETLNTRGALYNKIGNRKLALKDFTAGK